MRTFISLGLVLLLVASACGGGASDTAESDTSIEATAQAQATAAAQTQATAEAFAQATAEAQALATAEVLAQATATATSLEALISGSEGASFYADAYDGLSAAVRSRLDLAGIDKAQFVETLSRLGPGQQLAPELFQDISRLFKALGDLEVTFLPVEAWAGLLSFPAPVLQAAGLNIDEAAIQAVRRGTAFLTGNQAGLLIDVIGQFAMLEEDGEIPEPTAEEFLSFFAGLPPEVKAVLEANGWTPDRLADLIESDEEPSLEELGSLLGPLADIPVPPMGPMMQAFLTQFPAFLLGPFIEQVGQTAFDELKAGARAPTGGEFLAFFEVLMSMEDLGGEGPSPGPGEPDPEEIKSFFAGLPSDVKAELEANGWSQERIDALTGSDEDTSIEDIRGLLGPLGDIPVPFATGQVAFFLDDILEEFPTEAASLMAIIGQQALNEMASGARPPTGREYLAVLEVVFALGEAGALDEEPQPLPPDEELPTPPPMPIPDEDLPTEPARTPTPVP